MNTAPSPHLGSDSSVLLWAFPSGSSQAGGGAVLSSCRQAVCLLADTRGHSPPSKRRGRHRTFRPLLGNLGVPVLLFASSTLPEPHSLQLDWYICLLAVSGETAVLETSSLQTPPQKYKNTTRLVRKDTHLSPNSPYFIPSSSLCHTQRTTLVIMVRWEVNGSCHSSAVWVWPSHWPS